jgi:hypothetical protein
MAVSDADRKIRGDVTPDAVRPRLYTPPPAPLANDIGNQMKV